MEKYKHPANPERAKAEQERRRSNAAGTHADKRLARLRTRKERDEAAKKEFEE